MSGWEELIGCIFIIIVFGVPLLSIYVWASKLPTKDDVRQIIQEEIQKLTKVKDDAVA